MTEELRLVLLFAGLLIIGYIAWDAKRRKDNEDEKPEQKQTQGGELLLDTTEKNSAVDAEGYDDLGLTQARIANGPEQNFKPASTINSEQSSEIKNSQAVAKEKKSLVSDPIPQVKFSPKQNQSQTNPQQRIRVEPSFEDNFEMPDSNADVEDATIENSEQALEDISTEAIDQKSNQENLRDSSNMESLQKPETVITVNIMAEKDAQFNGSDLLQELLTLGFKFGDMGVFHRYQNANGQGERWFCLANAINPGTFDIDNMDAFSTPGLTLFMLLPGPQKPLEAFENMVVAANKLKAVLGGKLEDGSHSALSLQRIQLYREQILNFQRNHLAKISHLDGTD